MRPGRFLKISAKGLKRQPLSEIHIVGMRAELFAPEASRGGFSSFSW
jgi:hypothetical protein